MEAPQSGNNEHNEQHDVEQDEKEISSEKKKKCSDNMKNTLWNTGYFHDGVRRVDLVLVMQYSEVNSCELDVEQQQINCLMDLADAGFELELEPGTAPSHKDLIFVKLHCPEAMVQQYGTFLAVRKYFRLHHLQYMQEGIAAENDIIALVRIQYPAPVGYTTWERSIIVYRMLRVMAFNRTIEDTRGLQCLLDNKVVCDVFALHDGPYFMLPGQEVETINARQALFFTWFGWSNLYRGQPTHLIREYFGERVAFVFAFSETLVKVLAVLSAIGAVAFIIGLYHHEGNHMTSYISACNINFSYHMLDPSTDNDTLIEVEGLKVCPSCRDFRACPFRDLSTYCHEVYFKTLLDSPPCSVAALVAAIISWVFFFKWWRREEQFTWLWEVPVASSLNTTRVDCENKTIIPTGTHFCRRLQRAIIIFLSVMFIFCVNMTLIAFHNKLLHVTIGLDKAFGDFHRRKYLLLVIMGMMNGAVISLLEWPYRWLGHKLAKASNNPTDEDFDWSLMLKRCSFAFLIHYSLFYFYGVLKGFFYTYPADPKRWNMSLGLGMMNCGVLGCFDELFVVVVVTAATCRSFAVIKSFSWYCFRFELSDYSWRKTESLPCWEREYLMKPLKESEVLELILMLLMKYIHSTMLMAVIPLAPFVILVTLLWDIRSEARRLLLCRRRPLLVKSYGLGAWRWLLALLPLLIGLSNALVFALNTNMFDRLIFKTHFMAQDYPPDRWFEFIPKYMLSFFNNSDFKLTRGSRAEYQAARTSDTGPYCFFPGKYSRRPIFNPDTFQSPPKVMQYNSVYSGTQLKYYIHWQQALFIIVFQGMIAVCGAALWYEYWDGYEPSEIGERQAAEHSGRNYTMEIERLLAYKKKQCSCEQELDETQEETQEETSLATVINN